MISKTTHSEDIAPELMARADWRRFRSSMHAIYASADEFRLCGFVDTDHADRVARFLDPDAGCYPSTEPVSNGNHADGLRGLRVMEGVPSCRP